MEAMGDEALFPPRRNKAAGVYGWTEPLRALRKKHRRLAGASLRAAAITCFAALWVVLGRSEILLGRARWPLLAASLGATAFFVWLGARAAAQVGRIEREMDTIEADAVAELEKKRTK